MTDLIEQVTFVKAQHLNFSKSIFTICIIFHIQDYQSIRRSECSPVVDLLSTGILIKCAHHHNSENCVTQKSVFHQGRLVTLFASLCVSHTLTHTVHNPSLKTFSQDFLKELLFECLTSGEKLWKFGNHNQETSKTTA